VDLAYGQPVDRFVFNFTQLFVTHQLSL